MKTNNQSRLDALADAETLQPDSATGYSVTVNGHYLGRVYRNTNGWSFSTINGGFGSNYKTRRSAVREVREMADPGCSRAAFRAVPGLRGN
jgi:hypothetical protein